MSVASEAVNAAAIAFNIRGYFRTRYIENPIDPAQKGIYLKLLWAAGSLDNLKLEDAAMVKTFAKLEPSVMTEMKKLQAAARQFLNGSQEVLANGDLSKELGKDAYVSYTVVDGKIVVTVDPLL